MPDTGGEQRRRRVAEPHGGGDVIHPIGSLGERRPLQLARHGGDERQRRFVVRDASSHRREGVEHRCHEWRVEGMRDLKTLVAEPGGLERGDDCVERWALTGDDDVRGAVDRRDPDACAVGRNELPNPRLVLEDGDHRAAVREVTHQLASRRHQVQRILEAEDTRRARGRILTDRVPDHRVGLDAPRAPELGQAVLDGEDRRLGVRGVVDERPDLLVVAVQHLQERGVRCGRSNRSHSSMAARNTGSRS